MTTPLHPQFHTPIIDPSDERLLTYEGRRSIWADFVDSGAFVQGYAALRNVMDAADGRPRCCCLGVACELTIAVGADVVQRFDPVEAINREKFVYATDEAALERATTNPAQTYKDASSGFLPEPVQLWLGLSSDRPIVALDQQFIDDLATEAAEHARAAKDAGLDVEFTRYVPIPGLGAEHIPMADDHAFLHGLNDSHIPFALIAGLIRRERILDVKTGPVA